MKQLKEKIILLTGGSRGIGPIIAKALAKQGAKIALSARSKNGLEDTAAQLKFTGAKTMIFPADLNEPDQRKKLVDNVLSEFGNIDILINNAGLETEGAYTELPWSSIHKTIEVNLIAPMELTYLVLPKMIERKSGHIVNIASIAAKSGAPFAAAYSGTKAGIAEWTRGLRLELANTGVKFSTVFPGYVTEVGMFARFGMKPPRLVGSCTPSQVAKAVVNAIKNNKKESIVNTPPLRYSFMLNELSPAMGDWLVRVAGVLNFQRKKGAKLKQD